MPTLTTTVTKEVTPAELKAALADYAEGWTPPAPAQPFPHPAGTFLRFAMPVSAALKVDADLPILVLGSLTGTGKGIVAFLTRSGTIGRLAVAANQVRPETDPPAAAT